MTARYSRSARSVDTLRYVAKYSAAGSLLAGAAVLIPASLATEQPWTLSPSPGSVLALLGLAVFSTAAFAIYFRLIQTLRSVGTTRRPICACRSVSQSALRSSAKA
jgi:drug/metabolite transporter (DMT)-like permease